MNAAARAAVLELQAEQLEELFDSLDAAPLRERDLDPRTERYVVEWAREQRGDAALALVVRFLGADLARAQTALPQAVPRFFAYRARTKRQELRRLLRIGRISLAIGLAFVAAAGVAADLLSELRYDFLAESFVIGAWVALWRPLEIFLYDWWPIRAEARLFDRLAASGVRVVAGAVA